LNFNHAFENAQKSASSSKGSSMMLAIQDLLRQAGNPITAGPACPNCGRSMHLARIAPRSEGLSELRIFRCGECGVSLTEAADDASPAYRG
jgi:transposase-like protein